LAKGAFGPSFAGEDAEPEQGKEEAKTRKKKNKSKAGKQLTEDVNSPTERGRTPKRAASSSRDHLDDSRSRSRAPKRRQCRACGGFHLYKRCYYLFPDLAPEAWVARSEIKKVVKEALDEDKDFADEIKKLQIAEKKKSKED